MEKKAVPMIHVPNVRATVDWYKDIGFTVRATYDDGDDGLSFAILSFGSSEVMFNQGGQTSTQHRREVDLYIYTDQLDDLFGRLKERVDVVEGPHDTFYGMREFIFRDLNRFWITFAQESVFGKLMGAVFEGDADRVRSALDTSKPTAETLTAALAVASRPDYKSPEIARLLKKAGAVLPVEVDAETLRSYAGKYTGEQGMEFNVTFKDGRLLAAPAHQEPMSLVAVDNTTFRPVAFDNLGTLAFEVDDGKVIGCILRQIDCTIKFQRAE
jgi:uncharacterized glyoxalase superfamily protein PhnB